MTRDWLGWAMDRPLVICAAIAALVAIGVAVIIAAGGASCPKGQHEEFQYFQPVITTVNGVTTVNEIPVYACERAS